MQKMKSSPMFVDRLAMLHPKFSPKRGTAKQSICGVWESLHIQCEFVLQCQWGTDLLNKINPGVGYAGILRFVLMIPPN